MISEKIEDTLNGGYAGLYGEIVTEDIYRLRQLNFIPDVIFDLGCNIGIFTRYARSLFPDSWIIAVEPNEENCEVFLKFTHDRKNRTVLINKAIGNGDLWHSLGARNGTGEVYLSESLGYPKDELSKVNLSIVKSDIPTIMLDELIKTTAVKENEKFIIKCDIEGNEIAIFEHEPSMDALKKADFIAIEIHDYALNGSTWQQSKDHTDKALKELEVTHDCIRDGVNFWATKKY